MLFVIHAFETMYQGMHGIEEMGVFDLPNFKVANLFAQDMSMEVIESYGLEEEYDEDMSIEDIDLSEFTDWTIWKIKDEYSNMDISELDHMCCEDLESFVEKYAEECDG